MVTGLTNRVSRYCTAARTSLVNPAGADETLESQLMSMVNGVGDAGSAGKLLDVVAVVPDVPPTVAWWGAFALDRMSGGISPTRTDPADAEAWGGGTGRASQPRSGPMVQPSPVGQETPLRSPDNFLRSVSPSRIVRSEP